MSLATLMSKLVTHLIMVGITHLSHSPSAGVLKRVLPGKSIHADSHTSPRTFAKEVKISANTTSAKYIGPSIDVNRHLRIALGRVMSALSMEDAEKKNVLKELVAFAFVKRVDWADQDQQNHEGRYRRDVPKRVYEVHVSVGEVAEGSPGEKAPNGIGSAESIDCRVYYGGMRGMLRAAGEMWRQMGIGGVCVDTEVHRGHHVYAEKVEAVKICRPSENTQAGEDKDPEG
jgi:hypothetical protein